MKSRPTRARGLKFYVFVLYVFLYLSRPTRARGLKSRSRASCQHLPWSRPTRASGLKLSEDYFSAPAAGRAPYRRRRLAQESKRAKNGEQLAGRDTDLVKNS